MGKRLIIFFISLTAAALFWGACGGSASAPTTPTQVPISIDTLNGATDVAVDSSFDYSFTKAIDTDTVDETTFFIHEIQDGGGCDALLALDAAVSCSTDLVCTLDPTESLTGGTGYAVCILGGSEYGTGVFYKGLAFEGVEIAFTTEGEAPVVDYSEIFAGPCVDSAYESDDDSTYSYEFIVEGVGNTIIAECVAEIAYENGDTGCVSITSVMEAVTPCGLDFVDIGNNLHLVDEGLYQNPLEGNPDGIPTSIYVGGSPEADEFRVYYFDIEVVPNPTGEDFENCFDAGPVGDCPSMGNLAMLMLDEEEEACTTNPDYFETDPDNLFNPDWIFGSCTCDYDKLTGDDEILDLTCIVNSGETVEFGYQK